MCSKAFYKRRAITILQIPIYIFTNCEHVLTFVPWSPHQKCNWSLTGLKGKDTLSFSCISAAFKGRDTSSCCCISAATVPYSVGHNWAKCPSHQIGGGHLLLYCSSRNGQQTITSGSTTGQHKLHITYALGQTEEKNMIVTKQLHPD